MCANQVGELHPCKFIFPYKTFHTTHRILAPQPAYTQHWVLYTWNELIMSISKVGLPTWVLLIMSLSKVYKTQC